MDFNANNNKTGVVEFSINCPLQNISLNHPLQNNGIDLTPFISTYRPDIFQETITSSIGQKEQLETLNLDRLYKTYSEKELIIVLKKIFVDLDSYNTSMHFLAEFITMNMHELLTKLQRKTSVIDSNIMNQCQSKKRPIKSCINLCKTELLIILNRLRLVNFGIRENDKTTNYKIIFEEVDMRREFLIVNSKKLVKNITVSGSMCNRELKKYITFINIFETIYKDQKNKTTYLPWLYKDLKNTPLYNLSNTVSKESAIKSFVLMKKAKSFAVQTGNEYLKSFEEIASYIKDKKIMLTKLLKDKDEIEKLIKYLNDYKFYLIQRSENLKAIDIFLETGELGKIVYAFLNRNQEVDSDYFNLEGYENLHEQILEKQKLLLFRLIDNNKIYDIREEVLKILVKFKNVKIDLKEKFNLLSKILSNLDSSNLAATRPYLNLIQTLAPSVYYITEHIEKVNKIGLKINKNVIIISNGCTLTSKIIDGLNELQQILPKEKLVEQLDSINSLLYDSEILFSSTKEQLECFILMISNNILRTKKSKSFIAQSAMHHLECAIESVKGLIIVYKTINKDAAFKLIKIRQELVDIFSCFQSNKESVLDFLNFRPTLSSLTQKENELKEKIFLENIVEIEKNELKINFEVLNNLFFENESMKLFLKNKLEVSAKTTKLYNKLKEILFGEGSTKWDLKIDDYSTIKQLISQIRFIQNRYCPVVISDESMCSNNEELEFLQNFHKEDTEFNFALSKFSIVAISLTERWLEQEKTTLEKQIKLEKIQSSKEKRSKKSSAQSSKALPSNTNEDLPEENININKISDPEPPTEVNEDDEKSSEKNPLHDFEIESKNSENQQHSSEEISSNSQDSEEEVVKTTKNKKVKSSSKFKLVPQQKEKSSKPLPYWQEVALQVENIFEQFSIFQITSEHETYSNLLWRYQEFKKCEYNIQFNLGLIREITLVSCEGIPETVNWLWSQCWPLLTDCALRGMVTTMPECSRNNKEFKLYTHDAIKLYNLLNPEMSEELMPSQVRQVQKYLNHSYVGSLPPSSTCQPEANKDLLAERVILLKDILEKQKILKGNVVGKNEIENVKNVTNFLNREIFFTLPKKRSFSIDEYNINEKSLVIWIDQQTGKEDPVIFAKENILLALKQCRELIENGAKIKTKTPILYGVMAANLSNRLMSNVLHLFLAKHDLLKGEINDRLMIHCHHPLKLWKEIIKNKLIDDEHEKIAKAMELFSNDWRYPYGKKVSTEESLVEVFEIITVLTSSRKFENLSPRIQVLVEKYSERGEEKLQGLIDSFEANLKKCFDMINLIINK